MSDVKQGEPKQGELTQVRKGVQVGDCLNGALYFRLHYTADPSKSEEWAAIHRPPVGQDREWKREMEMDENVWSGQPVYATYVDDWHSPQKYWESGFPIIPGSTFWGGWDCGTSTLHPAFVLIQVTQRLQALAMCELTSQGESMEEFAPRVLDKLTRIIPGSWDEVRHYGDATLTVRSGANSMTAKTVARMKGINITPVPNQWEPRRSAVEWLLKRKLDETTPGFMLDGRRCPVLRDGFLGAYQLEVSPKGDQSGPGAVYALPLKNMYSHIQDALQYPAIKIRQLVEGGGARFQRD